MRRKGSHPHLSLSHEVDFTIGEWMLAPDFREIVVFDLRTEEEVKVRQ